MQNSKSASQSPEPLEDILTELFRKGEAYLHPQWQQVEDKIRQSPTKAVLIAAGIGYFLHRLPKAAMFGAALKIAWAIAPPAALAALAGKGFHLLENELPLTESKSKSRRNQNAAQGA